MRARFFCCALAAGFCETLVARAVWFHGPILGFKDWRLIAACHALAALFMFAASPKGRGWTHPSRLWGGTDAFLTLFLPFFGWLVAVCLHVFFKPGGEARDMKNEDDEEGFRVEAAGAPLSSFTRSREEMMAHHLDFVPLADILAGDDLSLKRGAVEKLAQLATPEAIAILLARRGDAVPEVRFFATSALTRLKKNMDEELDAAKRHVQAGGGGETRLMLAKSYFRQVRSGLLDAATADAYGLECDHHLEKAALSPETAHEALELLVDARQVRGDRNGAENALLRLATMPGADARAVLKKKVEIAYGASDYAAVVTGLKELTAEGADDPAWKAAAYLWGAT